ncbi:MAG: DUF1893 domain-containing protein [Syntrophales bacterium]|nr:DUF1893 domain-containing protein [Syntrophales bacterium]
MNDLFKSFLKSDDTLWVLKANISIFQSKKKGIASLLDYIEQFSPCTDEVTVFDRVVGNAAALLLERIRCRKIYSRIGSRYALETLNQHGIPSYFLKVVPYIFNRKRDGMCPFEQLSIGKSPDEFYKSIIS